MPKRVNILKLSHEKLVQYLSYKGVDICRFQEISHAVEISRDPEIHDKLGTDGKLVKYLEENSFGGLDQTVDRVYDNLAKKGTLDGDICKANTTSLLKNSGKSRQL